MLRIAFTKISKNSMLVTIPYEIRVNFIANNNNIMFNTNITKTFLTHLRSTRGPQDYADYKARIMLHYAQQ